MARFSLSTSSGDGLDLLRSRGPLVRLSVGSDPANVHVVHDVSTYTCDEGKPDRAIRVAIPGKKPARQPHYYVD
ncbi:hypothetical protein [Blastococcus haudaquaticus]|uniref:Uncharacterized protein n=1 Tax=Blastococcus haudaquaticus TaxID=1938745 RepID=A0A286GSG5_9ACTN|nr:hypothetical protein [Blastococcus haudaquaticus]SOD98478.1 hypothetical protein SAMN06272739_1918 [Blastococcus haudaquaticus]